MVPRASSPFGLESQTLLGPPMGLTTFCPSHVTDLVLNTFDSFAHPGRRLLDIECHEVANLVARVT